MSKTSDLRLKDKACKCGKLIMRKSTMCPQCNRERFSEKRREIYNGMLKRKKIRKERELFTFETRNTPFTP